MLCFFQYKKGKQSSENKNIVSEAILQISIQLVDLLVSHKIQSLTLYALTLKIYLSANQDISRHINELEGYLDKAVRPCLVLNYYYYILL